jgi:hypothetical protein
VHRELVPTAESLHPSDVDDGRGGGVVVLVGRGERIGVAVMQGDPAFLADLVDQRVVQVVGPRAHRRDEPGLDLGDVVLRDRAGFGLDGDVQPGQDRFAHLRGVLRAHAPEGLLEDAFDAGAQGRGEPVARQVHQAGHEPAEHVPPHDETQPLTVLDVEDGRGRLVQLFSVDLEQLFAGVVLEDVQQRPPVEAVRWVAGPIQHRLHLAAKDWDVPRWLSVGRARHQAEEPPFPYHVPLGAQRLDADVVQVVGLVDGRPRVRLGEVEQSRLACLLPHLGRQLCEAVRDRSAPAVAQQPQPRPRDGAQRVLTVFRPQLVLAVAEEREMVVGEPAQQG